MTINTHIHFIMQPDSILNSAKIAKYCNLLDCCAILIVSSSVCFLTKFSPRRKLIMTLTN